MKFISLMVVSATVWITGGHTANAQYSSSAPPSFSTLPTIDEARQQCEAAGHLWIGTGNGAYGSGTCATGGDMSGNGGGASAASPAPEKSPSTAEPEPGQCESGYDKARLACDPLSGAGLNPSEGAMVEAALQGGIGAVSQMSSVGQSAHEACSTAERLTKAMALIQGTRAGICKAMQSNCLKACAADIEISQAEIESDGPNAAVAAERLPKEKSMKRKCEGYEESFARQLLQAQQYAQSMLQSRTCAAMTKDQAPIAQNGTPNCNDENVKRTNMYCICQLNPRDARCGYNPGTGGTLGGGPGGNAGGVGGATDLTSLGDSSLDSDAFGGNGPNASGNRGSSGGAGGGAGGGGGGPALIGGGGRAGDGGSGSYGSRAGTQVIQGVSGGGSFQGYGRPGGAATQAGGGSSWMNKLKEKFNIKDALPDKDKLARGLAGMSKGAAADGITGAMGETIWQKASRQYRSQERGGGFLK